MKNIQELITHIRSSIGQIYETHEADAMAMLVVEHVLQLTRLQLTTERQRLVPEQTWAEVETIINRLKQHEPLQYVLGCAHFYGLELEVNPAVLIPRPETEELVDIIVKENKKKTALNVLDICTGSGCIPIALAAHLSLENITGLDISEPALAVARSNARKYGQNIAWLQLDILKDTIPLAPASLDIIVSNPPYVLEQEKKLMRANVLHFEPHLALFVPDTDALLFYNRIATVAKDLLKPNGLLYFEINEQQGNSVAEALAQFGFELITSINDIFGKERFVRATRKA